MNWWTRLVRNRRTRATAGSSHLAPEMPGWRVVERRGKVTVWQDGDGDALSLTRAPAEFLGLSSETAARLYGRNLAESVKSGLVEVIFAEGVKGPTVSLVYKRLDTPAFVFTGMLLVSDMSDVPMLWTIVALERGTTGVREAVVTMQLMQEGKLTPEDYSASWAQDPYDPQYAGVDRSTLRYRSDDERYDAQFPQHPLSKVRRELRRLRVMKAHPPVTST